jgi:hypothetical protein
VARGFLSFLSVFICVYLCASVAKSLAFISSRKNAYLISYQRSLFLNRVLIGGWKGWWAPSFISNCKMPKVIQRRALC